METAKLGENLNIDVIKLIDTRMLIQANSGGGKSWTIRKLLEETHGQVQQIVLDMEGEFRTLREKYDYLIIGQDGDIPLNMKSAELLAQKVLELNISVIIDLYELKAHERKHYVKLFLDTLMNVPKHLWHPVLVIVDEAHMLCPEKGESEASGSVIDLCTRGRKRGFCGILATQRISKLNKDACAELNNKLIGRTGLDIDMKRAGEELGFTTKSQLFELRNLDAGDFFAFGTAISTTVKKVKIGNVKTVHPKAGSRQLSAKNIPSSQKVKSALSKLNDLPKEAEKDLRDKQSLLQRISELKKEVRIAKSTQKVDERAIEVARQQGVREFKKDMQNQEIEYKKCLNGANSTIKKLKQTLEIIANTVSKISDIEIVVPELKIRKSENQKHPHIQNLHAGKPPKELRPTEIIEEEVRIDGSSEKELGRCAKKIYSFLCANQDRGFSKVQIGAMIGYSPKSGGFNNAIANLNSRNLIIKKGSLMTINPENMDGELITQGEEYSIDLIKNKLGKCPKEIFEVLLENPMGDYSKEELAESTQSHYSAGSGGFNNSIAKLNSLGFIERTDGRIKLHKEIEEMM